MNSINEIPPESVSWKTVHAREKFNNTGIKLIKGDWYHIQAAVTEQWKDKNITCNADGWKSERFSNPMKKLFQLSERWRVMPEVDWFTLIGTYANHRQNHIALGSECKFMSTFDDELLLSANDIPWLYWNNSGQIKVSIKCLNGQLSSTDDE